MPFSDLLLGLTFPLSSSGGGLPGRHGFERIPDARLISAGLHGCRGISIHRVLYADDSLGAPEKTQFVEIVKFTLMRARVSTGCPFWRNGLKCHCITASRAAAAKICGPLRICNSWIVPSFEISACKVTAPCTFICRASKG